MNTFHPSHFAGPGRLHHARWRTVVSVAAAPAALAMLELFHPHAHNLLALDVRRWLTVHYLQVPLFALSGLAVVGLVRTHGDFPALLCRAAMFVFVLCFVVFDTAAGLVVGSLVQVAHASGAPNAWQTPINAVWSHPILGGAHKPLLALVGRVSLSIGTAAAAVSLRSSGRPGLPVLLLALSGCVMYVFPSHASPGGPLTFGGLAVAAAWLEWARPRAARGQSTTWSRRVARPDWQMAAKEQREAAASVAGDRAPRDPLPVSGTGKQRGSGRMI